MRENRPHGSEGEEGESSSRPYWLVEGVERSFAWATRFRRLVKDYERYASTLADLHIIAFVRLMLRNVALLQTGQ